MPDHKWYVYILRCVDSSLYTGITTDLKRRTCEHNSQTKKGAKYTRSRQPVKVTYWEGATSRSSASKREHEIKKMSKTVKEALITRSKKCDLNATSSK
ncbi:MAG: GIY-YIG nuclease family protein [Gammaproteobacteria bacterium]|nr:GIY-YIG nuclease family protein [Gammaproteobacteria bacterium]